MKKLFTILGVCYVAMALTLAQSQGILSGANSQTQEQRESKLGLDDQRGGAVGSQIPGLEGGAAYELYPPTRSQAGRHGKVSSLVTRSRIPDFVDNCLIVWSADYCSACRDFQPIVKQLQAEGYTVYVINYTQNRELGKQWRVSSVPTSIVWAGGKEVKRFVGVVTPEQIKEHLKHEQPVDYTIW